MIPGFQVRAPEEERSFGAVDSAPEDSPSEEVEPGELQDEEVSREEEPGAAQGVSFDSESIASSGGACLHWYVPTIMGYMPGRILVVDDDPDLAEMIGIVLTGENFTPVFCSAGDAALEAFRAERPELILLDLMLPGKSGIDVCREIRQESGVPIIMLTAKSDTVDVVLGLESGADDYIPKPFKPRELIARIRARLRDRHDEGPETVRIGDIDIDIPGHTVTRDGEVLSLTPLEFDVLVALARSPGQVFTREVLLESVWGYRHRADTRLVNVHVQRLRAKVERDPDNPVIVVTVRGVGYKAGDPVP